MKVEYIDLSLAFYQHERDYYTDYKYKFTIVNSILKTHFKKLMNISNKYNSKTKSGYIAKNNVEKFIQLIAAIEKSNPDRCKKSHEKSLANYEANYKVKNKYINCEHEDLGSFGYIHGSTVTCPWCNQEALVW